MTTLFFISEFNLLRFDGSAQRARLLRADLWFHLVSGSLPARGRRTPQTNFGPQVQILFHTLDDAVYPKPDYESIPQAFWRLGTIKWSLGMAIGSYCDYSDVQVDGRALVALNFFRHGAAKKRPGRKPGMDWSKVKAETERRLAAGNRYKNMEALFYEMQDNYQKEFNLKKCPSISTFRYHLRPLCDQYPDAFKNRS